MNIISVRNPKYTGVGIEVMVEFEGLGEVCFHAVPTDPQESISCQLHKRAVGGEFGEILPYTPPPQTIPRVITARQGKLTLLDFGIYQNVLDYINSLTGEQGARARISWEAATEFNRDDLVLEAITQSLCLTSEEVDQMFLHGSTL